MLYLWFEDDELLEKEPLCYVSDSSQHVNGEAYRMAWVNGYDDQVPNRFLSESGDVQYARPVEDEQGDMIFRLVGPKGH